jgi:hypothetical protein
VRAVEREIDKASRDIRDALGTPSMPRETPFARLYEGNHLYTWQPGTHSSICRVQPPDGAIRASECMFVIRTPTGEVGKFNSRSGKATVALHGKEINVNEYEFLTLRPGSSASWRVVFALPGPCLAPLAWASSRMAVVRPADANRFPERDPGKYIADESSCCVTHAGKVVTLKEAEIEFLIIEEQQTGVAHEEQWVLVPPVRPSPMYFWERPTKVEDGMLVPEGAVKASDHMFVVRAANGEAGKFVVGEGVASVALNGREQTVDDYEFLVLAPEVRYAWSVEPPPNCVWASARMAVIRAADSKPPIRFPDRDPGKYLVDEQKARIAQLGKEVTLEVGEYEFLSVWRGTEVPGSTEVGLVVTGAGLGVCNGFYRLVTETPEWANGNPCFQNAYGATIGWGDTDWTRKKGYPEGVGCWGVGYDGHHRYMARGDSPLPPTTGWVVREDPKWRYPSVAPMLNLARMAKGLAAAAGHLEMMGAGLDVCNGSYRYVPEDALSAEQVALASGKPFFCNEHGAIIAWGDTDWTRKKGYPEGVGCWGVGYDGHHRYMARGDSPLPPTTGWVVREDPKWKYPSVAPMLRRNPAAASSKGEGAISGGGGAREALGPVVEARGEKLSAAAQAAEKLSNEAETFADLATQLRKANTGGFLGNFLAID